MIFNTLRRRCTRNGPSPLWKRSSLRINSDLRRETKNNRMGGMMPLPITLLEGRKVPRAIFSVHVSTPEPEKILSLMRTAHGIGAWSFDLSSPKQLESFRKLRDLTDDSALLGFCHLDAEEGVSLWANPSIGLNPKSSQRSGIFSLRI